MLLGHLGHPCLYFLASRMSSADGWTGSLKGFEKHSLFFSHLCKDAERLRQNTRGVEPVPFWAFQTIYEIRHSKLHVRSRKCLITCFALCQFSNRCHKNYKFVKIGNN